VNNYKQGRCNNVEKKKIYIIGGIVLIISFVALYVYSGREVSDRSGADRVTENIDTTRQQLADARTELERSNETSRSLQTTNQRLTEQIKELRTINGQLNETITGLSESNNEFERIIKEGKSENNSGRELVKYCREIVSGIQAKEPR
jgi:septal ring factor EnvC (AmiA/AmiB activator)